MESEEEFKTVERKDNKCIPNSALPTTKLNQQNKEIQNNSGLPIPLKQINNEEPTLRISLRRKKRPSYFQF